MLSFAILSEGLSRDVNHHLSWQAGWNSLYDTSLMASTTFQYHYWSFVNRLCDTIEYWYIPFVIFAILEQKEKPRHGKIKTRIQIRLRPHFKDFPDHKFRWENTSHCTYWDKIMQYVGSIHNSSSNARLKWTASVQ